MGVIMSSILVNPNQLLEVPLLPIGLVKREFDNPCGGVLSMVLYRDLHGHLRTRLIVRLLHMRQSDVLL